MESLEAILRGQERTKESDDDPQEDPGRTKGILMTILRRQERTRNPDDDPQEDPETIKELLVMILRKILRQLRNP